MKVAAEGRVENVCSIGCAAAQLSTLARARSKSSGRAATVRRVSSASASMLAAPARAIACCAPKESPSAPSSKKRVIWNMKAHTSTAAVNGSTRKAAA